MFWVTSYVLSRSGKCSAMTSGRRPLAGPSSALRRATMIATSSGEFGSTSTGGAVASAAASAAGFFCSRALDSVSIAPMSLPAALPPRSFGALTGDAAARRASSAVRGSAAILAWASDSFRAAVARVYIYTGGPPENHNAIIVLLLFFFSV